MLPAIREVSGIPTHIEPHVDEYETIHLSRRYGKKIFPGIAEAPIIFWDNDGETPDKRGWEDWWRKGYVLVGVGGSPLDEHGTIIEEEKENECAASLIAKELAITDPAVLRIVAAVKHNDLNGGADTFELPSLLRAMYRKHDPMFVAEKAFEVLEALEDYVRENDVPEDTKLLDLPTLLEAMYSKYGPEKAIEWTMLAADSKVCEQRTFWTETRKKFEKHGSVTRAKIFDGKEVTVAIIDGCDDPQVASYARSKYGAGAAVVIMRNSKGNMYVSASKKRGIKLNDTARIIRVEEQIRAGVRKTTDFAALGGNGRVDGAENWTFFERGNCLFNGRLNGNGVKPTRLSLENIVEMIEVGLNPKDFGDDDCDGKECRSNPRNPCPWYKYGLGRCRTLRFNNMRKTAAPQKAPATPASPKKVEAVAVTA